VIVFEALGSDFKDFIATATLPSSLRISAVSRSGNNISIQGRGVPFTVYVLQATNDLQVPFGNTQTSTATADANGNFQFTDQSSQPRRFYRVIDP
jgi:hypothetical protein